jgi:squalene-associated FAD-dependent desaturase
MSADVIVVGAGAAGLAAASALTASGAKVLVLERKPYVGGRAYSYEHPALGEVVDCQHVLLGCCTNLVHLLKTSDASEMVRWYDELTFLETNGNVSRIRPGGMPAPMHASMSFLQAPMLGVADKAGIARGLLEFMRGYPQDDSESAAVWLKRTGQTEQAIKHFWEPVLVGALNDSFTNCSTKYAGQVFHEAFLKSAEGGRLGIPRVPLSAMYGAVADAVTARGGEIVLRASVDGLAQENGGWMARAGDVEYRAESVVLALPFEQVQNLLPQLPDHAELTERLANFIHAPITTVHLWWDRAITELDHAVLLDTGIQWIFNKSRIRAKADEHYVELVISASAQELHEEREEIIGSALRELEMFFPRVREAKLLKSGVLKEARATFSVLPGLDQDRPLARTEWPGLYLAGDWTRTGWPSTMEGAVRSGYLAAEAVAGKKFLQPDLPAAGLMRLMAKASS